MNKLGRKTPWFYYRIKILKIGGILGLQGTVLGAFHGKNLELGRIIEHPKVH
jgi:hypothetical protein